MAVETELKLRIAPEQLARLKRHALIKTHLAVRPVTRRLQNIYYDTPKLDLHRSEMVLRLRHIGKLWLQSLKGDSSVQTGPGSGSPTIYPVNSRHRSNPFWYLINNRNYGKIISLWSLPEQTRQFIV